MDPIYRTGTPQIIVNYSMNNSTYFKQFWLNETFGNITVVLKKRKFLCHKIILSQSEVFKSIFMKWKSCDNILYLQNEDFDDDIMMLFLKLLYGYEIEIDALWLLILANKFAVKYIEDDIKKIMCDHIKQNKSDIIIKLPYILSVCNMLMYNIEHQILNILKQHIQTYIDQQKLHLLDGDILLELIQSDNLIINDEYELYKAVCEINNYDLAHKLLDHIRFCNMSKYLVKYICKRACHADYLKNQLTSATRHFTLKKSYAFINPRKYKLVHICDWAVDLTNVSRERAVGTIITKKFNKFKLCLYPFGNNQNGGLHEVQLYVRPKLPIHIKWVIYIINQHKFKCHMSCITQYNFTNKRRYGNGYGHRNIINSDDFLNPDNGWVVDHQAIIISRIFKL